MPTTLRVTSPGRPERAGERRSGMGAPGTVQGPQHHHGAAHHTAPDRRRCRAQPHRPRGAALRCRRQKDQSAGAGRCPEFCRACCPGHHPHRADLRPLPCRDQAPCRQHFRHRRRHLRHPRRRDRLRRDAGWRAWHPGGNAHPDAAAEDRRGGQRQLLHQRSRGCHAGRDPDAGRKSWRADRTSSLCHAGFCKQMGLEPNHELRSHHS